MITKYLIVFLISMVPLIELRGAIPYAVAFHIPVSYTHPLQLPDRYLVCGKYQKQRGRAAGRFHYVPQSVPCVYE